MYAELYDAWQRETESSALQPLTADFYTRVSEYLRAIKGENELSNKKTEKENLLEREVRNVTRIVKELLKVRYKKLLTTLSSGQKPPSELLTIEEGEIFAGLLPFSKAYRAFATGLLQGAALKAKEDTKEDVPHKRATLRFLKDIPAIIGGDMKPYGPFKAEDVGSVPVENAKLLVKQGLAEIVGVS